MPPISRDFLKGERIEAKVDIHSFEILFPPYYKDKNHVYYGKKYEIIEGADPFTFKCPTYKPIMNYQYFAYDKHSDYFFENDRLSILSGIDSPTFTVIGFYYAKVKTTFITWEKS